MAWVIIGAIFIIGLIVFLGAIKDAEGVPLIDNPGLVTAAAITAIGGLAAVVLPILLKAESAAEVSRRSSTDVADVVSTIRDNVQNSHRKPDGSPLHMRDDMDDKHSALMQRLDTMSDSIALATRLTESAASDIRGVRRDIGNLSQSVQGIQHRVQTVERNQDRMVERLHDVDGRGGAGDHHPLMG